MDDSMWRMTVKILEESHATEIDALKRENEKLRYALKAVVITRGEKIKYDEGYETYDPIALAKEALK